MMTMIMQSKKDQASSWPWSTTPHISSSGYEGICLPPTFFPQQPTGLRDWPKVTQGVFLNEGQPELWAPHC